jgi:7,8-dihydro-6-hydroxymethylpterin-pyrophosphokinase
MRVTNFIIGFILLTLTTLVTNSFASIGEVTIHNGSAVIDRQDGDKDIEVEKQLDVFSYDTVKTGQGQVGIKFIDDTRVDVTAHSKLIIDEFVYDPNTNTGKLSLKATLGTVRYASGQIAKNSAQNVNIKTPTATIAVRGTDFAMTVNEIGGSTIVLLPSCNGNGQCYVGEIEVQTDAGFVIMNQAFQATQVDTTESKPLKPVLLNLDEDMINNLLIVAQPKEIEDQVEEEKKLKQVANALDIDFLKFDDLEVDLLETEEEEFTGLDVDFLDQDFLVDILAQLNKQLALQMRSEFDKRKDKKKSGVDEFGVTLLDEDPQWVWMRSDESNNNIVLRLDQEYGYIINVTQGDTEILDYELGDGATNVITINQQ